MNEHKLAVFVEGQTEQIFVERLITELASARHVGFARLKATGGGANPRQFIALGAVCTQPAARFYVQIVDSATDGRVVSDIHDNQAGLAREGFEMVLGIRDVYPTPRADIPLMRAAMARVLAGSALPIDVVLAVMEVEAWFLGEHHHLAKMGRGIAVADVIRALGFDPSTGDMESRAQPAADLHAVYQLAGRAYHKTRVHAQTTVDALDYEHLYCSLADRMSSLRQLVDALDRFLASR
ncbi:MAG: hypothetical protein QM820_62645 [Minicystis sp.]